ncbi:AAA family ATPase [Hansschlegelia sp. KR7-227]|uniref:AAA family ATPase n=1 Tax=Hansschlegelia sp. KR7-227 TaxID=3400914 RepID=UPI003C012333
MSDVIDFAGDQKSGRSGRAPRTERMQRIAASPFVWRDPATLPRRRWLYGTVYIRRFLSLLIAAGEVGKTALLIAEALALVTARDLLGVRPRERCRVWLINLEDPMEELERRVLAAMLHFGIDRDEVEGWLFLDSGRDMRVLLTMNKDGALAIDPVASEAIIGTMQENQIDVLILDPFVSLHTGQENDNVAIDMIAKELGRIAELTNASIMLAHHSRKIYEGEVKVEDSRGASALLAAARVARVLNKMPKADAERWEIDNPRLYFRADNGKSNLAPPAEKADWHHIASVRLGNGTRDPSNPFDFNQDDGDSVGVVTTWEPPSALAELTVGDLEEVQRRVRAGKWRESPQAAAWVGKVVADVKGWDLTKPGTKKKVNGVLGSWYASKALEVYSDQTDKREWKDHVRVGPAQ